MKANQPHISAERLRELLRYEPDEGNFFWRSARGGRFAGALAGRRHTEGYWIIKIAGKDVAAHRLAFLYMNGQLPLSCVDHINGERSDNRWSNLREANYSENMANSKIKKNNKSGRKGVIKVAQSDRFIAAIRVNGISRHLGIFDNAEDAARAYRDAACKYFGEFARYE